MSAITTHVLDTSKGKPASGLKVTLSRGAHGGWKEVGTGLTDDNGRIGDLLPAGAPPPHGTYALRFDVADYFGERNVKTFYPYVEVVFGVHDDTHYHVPLLLSPFGYTTYRGS